MKRTLSLIALLALSACGRAPTIDHGPFQSYIDAYENEANERGKSYNYDNLTIQYGPLDSNRLGLCMKRGNEGTITVKYDFDQYNEYTKEVIIYHELGHCISDLVHYSKVPAIMNGAVLDGYYFNEHRKELFDLHFGN